MKRKRKRKASRYVCNFGMRACLRRTKPSEWMGVRSVQSVIESIFTAALYFYFYYSFHSLTFYYGAFSGALDQLNTVGGSKSLYLPTYLVVLYLGSPSCYNRIVQRLHLISPSLPKYVVHTYLNITATTVYHYKRLGSFTSILNTTSY